MAEQVHFIDSFDHAGTGAYAALKYRLVVGAFTEVTGPYHGVGARFAATGNELRTRVSTTCDSAALSASVRVDASGWTGAGEAALLAPGWFSGGAEFPHHWLTVDSAGILRVRSWQGAPFPPGGPPNTVVLAASAAGALPLGVWCRLEYGCQIRSDSTSAGTVSCRVDGTEVLAGSGLVTHDPTRAVVTANTWRVGHLLVDESGTDGVGGLGSGGGAVGVAFDDLCLRVDTTIGAAALAHRDDPALPHRVVCLFPTGPGDAAELPVTGAAANWAACAEAPPDGDTSTVAKVGLPPETEVLPIDRYATTAAPTVAEAGAGAQLFVWGLARSSDSPARAVVAWTDGLGDDNPARLTVASTYRYIATVYPQFFADIANDLLAGMQVGWGSRSFAEASLTQTYVGTQVVAELWYRPTEAPEPPPTGGGARWSVGWVP